MAMVRPFAWIRGIVLLGSLGVASCAPANGPYTVSVAPGVHPRLTAQEAIAISRGYLDDQTPELADPELHRPPRITRIWAIGAHEAPDLDGCIPLVGSDQIVWVTMGQRDYLNLSDRPWSKVFSAAFQLDPDPPQMNCEAPGPL